MTYATAKNDNFIKEIDFTASFQKSDILEKNPFFSENGPVVIFWFLSHQCKFLGAISFWVNQKLSIKRIGKILGFTTIMTMSNML